MTLMLHDAQGNPLEVKSYGVSLEGVANKVRLGELELPLSEFLNAVRYVMTNTDLYNQDPRAEFIDFIADLGTVKGYNPKGVRLAPLNGGFKQLHREVG